VHVYVCARVYTHVYVCVCLRERREIRVHAGSCARERGVVQAQRVRLSALMNLYIHPLYVLVSKILSSILNSPALIHPLYHPLSTVGPTCHLSKYIHV
jgi:hypothetical protein